ncbi:hypothetical protein HPB48_008585 [Haemaphysalis longicornis]|uniref:SCP domain-containing protein n=1 Tax=Haemaphysalis longicornis TaxID=44386 RepID=A0A9J6GSD7_HAELO|nr:hypothetical protein HPB48_008585 [Haemaphysalis longicornis]
MADLTFWLLLVAPTLAAAAALRPNCQQHPSHTLCRTPNPACIHKKRGVDAAAAALILKVHNDFRSKVAQGRLPPFRPAADMQELVWDDELAEVAQAHADLCTDTGGEGRLKHDLQGDRTTAKFPYVGQNLASQYGVGQVQEDWRDAIERWYNESAYYSPNRIAVYTSTKGSPVPVGHFTQVIWANTRYLGCGYLQYYVRGGRWTDVFLYTCNYGPGGNIVRQSVYQEGPTCSACPAPTVCNQNTGLCGGGGSGQPPPQPPPRPRPLPPPPQPPPRPRPFPPPPRPRPFPPPPEPPGYPRPQPRPRPRPFPPRPQPPYRPRPPLPPPPPRPDPFPDPGPEPPPFPEPGSDPSGEPGPVGGGGDGGGGGGGGHGVGGSSTGGGGGSDSPDPELDDDSAMDPTTWLPYVASLLVGFVAGTVVVICLFSRYNAPVDPNMPPLEPAAATTGEFQSTATSVSAYSSGY